METMNWKQPGRFFFRSQKKNKCIFLFLPNLQEFYSDVCTAVLNYIHGNIWDIDLVIYYFWCAINFHLYRHHIHLRRLPNTTLKKWYGGCVYVDLILMYRQRQAIDWNCIVFIEGQNFVRCHQQWNLLCIISREIVIINFDMSIHRISPTIYPVAHHSVSRSRKLWKNSPIH